MKKLLAMLVLAALVMTACFASAETASDPYMANARSYLRTMYKMSPETTMADYLWSVVAAEMPAAFEPEALKAQACAARTYTV